MLPWPGGSKPKDRLTLEVGPEEEHTQIGSTIKTAYCQGKASTAHPNLKTQRNMSEMSIPNLSFPRCHCIQIFPLTHRPVPVAPLRSNGTWQFEQCKWSLWSLYTNKYAPGQPTAEAQCHWFTNLLPLEERTSHWAAKSSFSPDYRLCGLLCSLFISKTEGKNLFVEDRCFCTGFFKWKYLCNSDPNFQKVNKFSKGCTAPSPVNSWFHEQRDGVTMFKRQIPKSHPPVCHCTGTFNPRCTEGHCYLSHGS